MAYIPLLLFIIFFELFRKKRQKVDSLSIFNLSYLTTYVVTLVLWAAIPDKFEDVPYNLNYNASEQTEVFLTFYFAYFCFIFFYKLLGRVRFRVGIVFNYIAGSDNDVSKRAIYIVLLFSCIIVFNIVMTGGVSNYIAMGNEARHHKVSFGISGYLNYFLSASLSLSILLTFLYKASDSLLVKIMVALSGCLIFIGMLSRGGRADIVFTILYIIIYLYYMGLMKLRFSNVLISFVLGIFCLFVIYNLRQVSFNFMNGEQLFNDVSVSEFYDNLLMVVIYPFKYSVHMVYVVSEFFYNQSVYNYPRLGIDLISSFIILIPGLSGDAIGLPALPDIISQQVMGKYNGYIPPGWVGWSLLDGGIIFLTLKSFWTASVFLFLDKSYERIKLDAFGKTIYFILVLAVADLLLAGTAMNLIRGNVGTFTLLALLFFVPFFRVGKLKLVYSR